MHNWFDAKVAKEVGITAAILFQDIGYLCGLGNSPHDGRSWVCYPVRLVLERFPYMTDKSIRGGLRKLVDAGLVIAGNYNEDKRDRTTWYALSDKGNSFFMKD